MKGITLIGMARAGKTTLGPVLADKLSWPLYDIDQIMRDKELKNTGHIVKAMGSDYLISLESKCVQELDLCQSVVVTPGSIVYDTSCHAQLKAQTDVIWLDTGIEVIRERLVIMPNDNGEIIGLDELGLEHVFYERRPLYESLADFTVDTKHKDPETIANEVIELIRKKADGLSTDEILSKAKLNARAIVREV